jgi:hypothetical protein
MSILILSAELCSGCNVQLGPVCNGVVKYGSVWHGNGVVLYGTGNVEYRLAVAECSGEWQSDGKVQLSPAMAKSCDAAQWQ